MQATPGLNLMRTDAPTANGDTSTHAPIDFGGANTDAPTEMVILNWIH